MHPIKDLFCDCTYIFFLPLYCQINDFVLYNKSWFARILFSAQIKTHFHTFSWTVESRCGKKAHASQPQVRGVRKGRAVSPRFPLFSHGADVLWRAVVDAGRCDCRVCLLGGRERVYIRLADSSRRSAGNWGGDRYRANTPPRVKHGLACNCAVIFCTSGCC